MRPAEITRDVATLNLSRYVEEVVTAILESNIKVNDLPVVLALCKAMHQRYSAFLSTLVPGLWAVIRSKPTEETGKLRRVYVRLVTDFLLNGLTTETKPIMKLIAEVTGGKDGSYNVTDAHIVLAFVKSAGFEILGTKPSSICTNLALVNAQASKSESAGESEPDSTNPDAPVLVTREAAAEGTSIAERMDGLLNERAVSPEISQKFFGHCEGAFGTLSKSLVATDSKLKKMEKRCDNDRLLAGTLTESREKGLQDARKLRETLWKSVETMSDILGLPMPQLEEEEDDEQQGGSGVEVWTKTGTEDEDANFGPFDDEETRAFYCDVPDYLTTIPPALLGLSEDQIEQRKAENLAKYGAGLEVDAPEADEEVSPSTEAELEAAEEQEGEQDGGDAAEEAADQNEDTPHYKLMVLLEQELPECNRREKVDELSEKFCTNHGSSKNSRKRLSQTLFQVPRTRLDLLPYYSRMATTCSLVWPDVGQSLAVDLEQQFHGQAKFKKNQNIESRLRTARYIGELTKFRFAPPIVSIRCLRRCLDDFTGGNVDVACSLLESCGRYLYRLPHTNKKLTNIMDTMVRLSKAKRLDERSLALLNSALYTVKPPTTGRKKVAKEYSPLEGYLRHLLMVSLQPDDESIQFVAKQLLRFPWNDPSQQCTALVCKIMLKTCRVGRYRSIYAVANVAGKLRRQKPDVCVRLLDAVVEELQWSMEHPSFKDQQRVLAVARLLGELHCAGIASSPLILHQLYLFLNFGHEIPQALRDASTDATQDELEHVAPVLNSASGAANTILEDEEMEDAELETKEEIQPPQPVAVSGNSQYDPRVPSTLDPPSSVFRIKLACTLLEVASKSLVTKSYLPKISNFLAAFQRYLFTKSFLPTEVEFSLLDTFDILDSEYRKVTKDKSKKDDEGLHGFPRYATWLEAHNATVANEDAEAATERRAQTRLENQAGEGEMIGESNTIASDSFHDEEDGLDREDDFDSGTDDGMSASASVGDDSENMSLDDASENDDDKEAVIASGTSIDDESEDESDESEDDSEEEDFDEDAYMQQLEAEAFEAELRRLTMDALEKGKSTARGGKVSDYMPTGSQFLAKKQNETAAVETPAVALSGMEGISFSLLKKGNKGKMESKQFMVPKDTNLAAVATKQDDKAAKERDMIKARVLQYEADAAESEGGNVYLDQTKITVIRNRPLSMDEIDKNFGTSGGNYQNPRGRRTAGGGHGTAGRGGGGGAPPVSGRGLTYVGGARGHGAVAGRGGGRGRGRSNSGRGLV
ncbi:MAG: hypothetical protein SGILL_002183 [Bacillariaceae sp.]